MLNSKILTVIVGLAVLPLGACSRADKDRVLGMPDGMTWGGPNCTVATPEKCHYVPHPAYQYGGGVGYNTMFARPPVYGNARTPSGLVVGQPSYGGGHQGVGVRLSF